MDTVRVRYRVWSNDFKIRSVETNMAKEEEDSHPCSGELSPGVVASDPLGTLGER